MNIFKDNIKDVTFKDVVAFCKEENKEGIQLDYKRDLPTDISKRIVAFANTRGGLIIVGVEEDKKTGIPVKWDGIKSDAKLVERIWQLISNIHPLPSCEVYMTNPKSDKSFLLIRILEGSQTPYFVYNDNNLWVRTGNISNPIDIASPDYAQLLFKKRESAIIARNQYISQAKTLFDFSLKNADRERKSLISEEHAEYERKRAQGDPQALMTDMAGGFKSRFYQKNLGSEASMNTILIQPFYPSKALLSPFEIKEQIINIRDLKKTTNMYFPDLNMKPAPQGLISFEWGQDDGRIDCHQIYSTGLIYSSQDVLSVDRDSGNKLIYISHIVSRLFQVLKAASNFYQLANYKGGLEGYVEVEGTENISLVGFQRQFFGRENRGLLPGYKLDFFELDTAKIDDSESFQEFYISYVKDLFWSFGYANLHEDVVKGFLKEMGWLIE